jgi:iron complex transport system ATP-binding protein
MKLEVVDGQYYYTKEKILFRDLNFIVNEGKILAVLGPNGVGKTTLLKCITSLLKWKSGRTIINGQACTPKSEKSMWRKMGYVPQNSNLKFSYLVKDMVLMGRAAHIGIFATPSKKDWQIALSAMDRVGIIHLKDKHCFEISGGERQLVLIARALAAEPQILILDEPESHLDFRNQLLILSILEKVVREENLSCILNTHYPDHALRIADKTLILGAGAKYLFGDTKDVVTEETLKHYFRVSVKIIPYNNEQNMLRTIIPLSVNV